MVVFDGDMVLGMVADIGSGQSAQETGKPELPPGLIRRDAAIMTRSYESLWPDPVVPHMIGDGSSDTQR